MRSRSTAALSSRIRASLQGESNRAHPVSIKNDHGFRWALCRNRTLSFTCTEEISAVRGSERSNPERSHLAQRIVGWLFVLSLLSPLSVFAEDLLQEYTLGPNEILVKGSIVDIGPKPGVITLAVATVVLPAGDMTDLTRSRTKLVVIGGGTIIHVRGDADTRVPLAALAQGVSIIAIGRDLGTGRPLPAREIAVWTTEDADHYSFERPVKGIAPPRLESPAAFGPYPTVRSTADHDGQPTPSFMVYYRATMTPGTIAHEEADSQPGSSVPDTEIKAAAAVRELTHAHTRIVWAQTVDVRGKADGDYSLAGIDTDDDSGIHTLVSHLPSCVKPLITPRGDQVVFSNRKTHRVYVVRWNGAGVRRLIDGFAVAVWRDPQTGLQWVYARTGEGQQRSSIRRYRLDKPWISELIWDRTPLDQENYPWFQLSADGKRAACAFPWPKCGIAELPNGEYRVLSSGCWTSMAPDNSYRYFHFDGTHKHVVLYDADGSNRRLVTVNDAPGVGGDEVLYPRWSNEVRFLTMTGPCEDMKGQIYIGKFNSSFTEVQRWARVTDSAISHIWPDAWIEPNGLAVPPHQGPEAISEPAPAPTTPVPAHVIPLPSLEIEGTLLARSKAPTYQEIAPYSRELVVFEYRVDKVINGSYDKARIRIARWAMLHKELLPVSHEQVGETETLNVAPFDSDPKLESEYLRDDLPTDLDIPLYYEPISVS